MCFTLEICIQVYLAGNFNMRSEVFITVEALRLMDINSDLLFGLQYRAGRSSSGPDGGQSVPGHVLQVQRGADGRDHRGRLGQTERRTGTASARAALTTAGGEGDVLI